MITYTIPSRLISVGHTLLLCLLFFFGQAQAMDATYDGIYQWSPGNFLSLHQDGTNMIATIYFNNDGNVTVPATVGAGTLLVPQLDLFDLMHGEVTGSTATIDGTRFHRACNVGYDFKFNIDSSITVTRIGVSNTPAANSAGISCSAILSAEASTLTVPKIRFNPNPQLVWTYTDDGVDLGIPGVSPGSIVLPNGDVRLYATDLNGGTVYRSSDGLVFHVEAPRAIAGSDPTVLLLPDGSYRAYFLTLIGGVKTIMTATSSDGLSWASSVSTGISNQTGSIAWGVPTAIKTPSGSIRLYWVDAPAGAVPGLSETIESATSVDGVNFVRDSGHRATDAYVDPQIIKADASDWVALFSTSPGGRRGSQQLYLGTSTDGLAWTIDSNPIIVVANKNAFDPASVRLGPNTFRIYYAVSPGPESFTGPYTLQSGVLKRQ